MAKGDPPTSPWMFWFATDTNGFQITATVTFSGTITAGTDPATWTNPLTGGTVFRDSNCAYTKVIIGVGPDGTPNTSTQVISVPAGTTQVTANQLASVGLHTVADVFDAPQTTAIP